MRIPQQTENYRQAVDDICDTFSVRFKLLKDERCLTLEDIADIIGTSRQSVVYYTMGSRLPGKRRLKHNRRAQRSELARLIVLRFALIGLFPVLPFL